LPIIIDPSHATERGESDWHEFIAAGGVRWRVILAEQLSKVRKKAAVRTEQIAAGDGDCVKAAKDLSPNAPGGQ
jgi:hypothetical protein